MTGSRSRDRDEGGAAVVIALGLTALLVLVALVCGSLVALVATHRGVQGAADLAALAGATALRGGRDACAVAGEIAAAHRTQLRDCGVQGAVVAVVLEDRFEVGPVSEVLLARARAGPADAG